MAVRRDFMLPTILVACNFGLFILSSWCILSGAVGVSHHWLFPFHEALVLAQAVLIRRAWAVKALTGLSCLVLLLTGARIETIYLSHHLLQAAITWGLGSAVHLALSSRADSPWRHFNFRLGRSAPLVAGIAAILAVKQGVWWGIGE
jgi:hypothetical protein